MKYWRLALGFLLFWAAAAFAPVTRAQEVSALADLSLVAHLEGEKTPITSGLVWRLYADPTDGTPARFVTDSHDASPTLKLQPGAYIIHVTYGFSGTTRRVVLGAQPLREDVTISAGALTLAATVSDTPIPPDRVSFAIYVAVGTDPVNEIRAMSG